jgi:YbbR domain-containing protein
MKNIVLSISLIALFSIGMWISVALSEEYIITVRVPVEFVDLPEDYSVGFSSVDEVFLQIKGKGWELAKLNLARKPAFEIPVHKKIGHHKNNFSDFVEANTWLSSTFQIIDIAPYQVEYDIEKSGTKEVKISRNFKLEFRDGYGLVSKVRIEPETVTLSGSTNILKTIDSVKTDFREITDINEDKKFNIPLEDIDGVTISKNECRVSFEVQKIVEKSFNDIIVETQDVPLAKELVLFPPKINVVLRGGINRLGLLTNDSIRVYVDFWSAMKENSGSIEPVIEIPKFTNIIDVEPKTLEFIIKQH